MTKKGEGSPSILDMDFGDLLNRIDAEEEELEEALGGTLDDDDERDWDLVAEEADSIVKEAVDIANYCMFIACNAARAKRKKVS